MITMNKYGMLFDDLGRQEWAVADDFMPADMVALLYIAAKTAWQAGKFKPAHIGTRGSRHRNPQVRGDNVLWLDHDNPAQAVQHFLHWATDLQKQLNRHFFLGIRRHEFHFARYGVGDGYQTHLDQHRKQPHRQLTLILYLNPEWGDDDGGELCMFCMTDHTSEIHRVRPRHNRLVLFRSGRIPHCVLPCARPRWSLTGWFRTDDDELAGLQGSA